MLLENIGNFASSFVHMRQQQEQPAMRSPYFLWYSLTAFGRRRQSVTLEVVHRHEILAPESGVEFMATITVACIRGLMLYSVSVTLR